MGKTSKEVCLVIWQQQQETKLFKNVIYNVWQAVTWTDDIEDGMTVLDEEIAEESHGSRPYVLLIERLINDGWEILPSAPQTGTFVRNRE